MSASEGETVVQGVARRTNACVLGGGFVGGARIDAYRQTGKESNLRDAIAGALRGAVDSTASSADGRFVFGTFTECLPEILLRAIIGGKRARTQNLRVSMGPFRQKHGRKCAPA